MDEEYPISDALDTAILMHCHAHFGGQLAVMLDYYRRGGKGVSSEFEIKYIENLKKIEEDTKQNLAATLLSGSDAEKIAKSLEAYKRLRSLYEQESPEARLPRLIADLILSEDEKAEEEIAAIVQEKDKIVPALLEVLRAHDFYDPLFPGYGTAPALAAKCLGLIGDRRAIISLFETIGEGDFFEEDIALNALKQIGVPAKNFLLKVLRSHPVTSDNERAAIALLQFKEDYEVSKACFDLLKEDEVLRNIPFATYLVLDCEGLKGSEEEEDFKALAKDLKTPSPVRQEIKTITNGWK